ncbi:MAG: hypothetical protein E6G34_00280 [Actinobacteria bacterium]|nr:MAG: hypothetical protein E6G34_00280 [Actinomycetota bacterium]
MAPAASIPLNLPRPARVRTEGAGVPVEVDGRAIELIRESWLVEDRWWTERPLRRRYWEAVTTTGRNVVVYHDLVAGARGGAQGPARAEDGAARHGGEEQACGGWYTQAP